MHDEDFIERHVGKAKTPDMNKRARSASQLAHSLGAKLRATMTGPRKASTTRQSSGAAASSSGQRASTTRPKSRGTGKGRSQAKTWDTPRTAWHGEDGKGQPPPGVGFK